jgi:signal transduction histidine kinase
VLLTPVSGASAMIEAVLALAVQAVPLRSAILVENREAVSRLHAWSSPRDGAERLSVLEKTAVLAYARTTGLPVAGVETSEAVIPGSPEPGPAVEPVTIPLGLRSQPSFGVLQLEPARPIDEADLAFLNAAAGQIAIALDRHYGRRRERALRKQAEHAEKDARLVSENLERLVAERTAQLEQTIKDLHAFAYSIAHDLRAPLRHIHGYSEFLIQGVDQASQPYARRVMAASLRMDRLIEDLLLYSRLTLDTVQPEPVAPSEVLARVLSAMDPMIRGRKARVDVESSLPKVLAHPVPLAQIFENLLSNALKFTPRGVDPHIRVRSDFREGWVRLVVEDNGIGIEPAHQGKIFEVFQRLHKSEDYPGTGIGLAIVRRAAERLGGCVGVESAVGRGSRFWVELKRAV